MPYKPVSEGHPEGWYNYFLVRPRGIDQRTSQNWVPTVVQFADGQYYAPDNELKPLYFGQNEPRDSPFRTELEWRELPDHD